MAKKNPKASSDTRVAAAARGVPGGKQVRSIAIGDRTYVAGNKKDEADLAAILSADQVADLTARGVFAAAE